MDSDTPDSPAAAAPTNVPASVPAPAPVAAIKAAASPFNLTVKFAFADYHVGQSITDAGEVAAVLAGENTANVLKTLNA